MSRLTRSPLKVAITGNGTVVIPLEGESHSIHAIGTIASGCEIAISLSDFDDGSNATALVDAEDEGGAQLKFTNSAKPRRKVDGGLYLVATTTSFGASADVFVVVSRLDRVDIV